jgi:hypothetical protein
MRRKPDGIGWVLPPEPAFISAAIAQRSHGHQPAVDWQALPCL